MHVCTYVYIYIYTYIHVYITCVYIYIYICIHTCIKIGRFCCIRRAASRDSVNCISVITLYELVLRFRRVLLCPDLDECDTCPLCEL